MKNVSAARVRVVETSGVETRKGRHRCILYCDRIVMKSSEQSRKRVAARAPIWNAQEAEIATVTYESYLYTLRNRNRSQKR